MMDRNQTNAGTLGARFRGIAPIALGIIVTILLTGGCGTTNEGATDGLSGMRQYPFWPQFPDEPRIQFLKSFAYVADVDPVRQSTMDRLIYGEQNLEIPVIEKPYGVDMFDGRIYVCDIRAAGVVVLDLRKQETRMMGVTGMRRLSQPRDVAVAPDGMIYVADIGRNAVFVFDANERYFTTFGHKGFSPVALAVYENELFACDRIGKRIEVLDRHTGETLRTFGEGGVEDGQFMTPLGIDVDKQGNVYVVDLMRCRVQKFSREGELLAAFGGITDVIGGLIRPKHVAVDSDGHIFVVDAAFQNVQLFNDDGRLYMHFGSAGGYPGAMFLPVGIAVHDGDLDLFEQYVHPGFAAQRLVVVTNQMGRGKVSVYALGRLREGVTVADIAAARVSIPSAGLAPGELNDGGLAPDSAAGIETEPLSGNDQPSDQPAPSDPQPDNNPGG